MIYELIHGIWMGSLHGASLKSCLGHLFVVSVHFIAPYHKHDNLSGLLLVVQSKKMAVLFLWVL